MAGERFHYLDAARTLLMASLIPYHTSLAYNPFDAWKVWSPDRSPTAAVIGSAIIMVLLPGFFLASGLFSALSLTSKDPKTWARSRLVRLGVPLVATALLLNPVQMAAQVANNDFYGVAGPSFVSMVTTPGPQWIRHLWFLPALIIHSLLLAAIWSRLAMARDAIERFMHKQMSHWFSAKLIGVAACIGVLCLAIAVLPKLIGWDMWIGYGVIDGRNTLYFLPFFLIGAILYLSPSLLDAFTQPRLSIILITAILMVVHVFAWRGTSMPMRAAAMFCETAGGLLGTQVLFAAMRRYADRPSALVTELSAASFTIYLFHQPIISALAALLLPVRLPALLEFAGICIVTYALAYLAYLVVSRSGVLMFLFNGVPFRRRARSA